MAGALSSVVQAGSQAGQGSEVKERCARALQSLQRIIQAPGTPAPAEGTEVPPPELLQIPADLALPAGCAQARQPCMAAMCGDCIALHCAWQEGALRMPAAA